MGGGGGGGGGWSKADVEALLDQARTEIRAGTGEGRVNAFLSFAYEDINQVNLLRGQAKNENSPIEFNDWSVQEPYESTRAEYIKSKIAERIRRASVTVVYLSPSAAASRWVKWEVEKSIELGKRVIGVYAGALPPPIPDWIRQNGIRAIPWAGLADEL